MKKIFFSFVAVLSFFVLSHADYSAGVQVTQAELDAVSSAVSSMTVDLSSYKTQVAVDTDTLKSLYDTVESSVTDLYSETAQNSSDIADNYSVLEDSVTDLYSQTIQNASDITNNYSILEDSTTDLYSKTAQNTSDISNNYTTLESSITDLYTNTIQNTSDIADNYNVLEDSVTDLYSGIAQEVSDRQSAIDAVYFSTFDVTAHIANTSNPHSVTKSQVGLSNVTDDAQLKRSSADFTSFSEKTTSDGNDVILIEDAGASQAKKYTTIANINHNSLKNVGTLTHSQIDAHLLADTTAEFTITIGTNCETNDEGFKLVRISTINIIDVRASRLDTSAIPMTMTFVSMATGNNLLNGALTIGANATQSDVISSTNTVMQDSGVILKITGGRSNRAVSITTRYRWQMK